jgi:alpha-methylacyl-CoA racemase
VTPVLAFGEVPAHPHMAARGTVVDHDGALQAAPAPRFSRTPTEIPASVPAATDVGKILNGWDQR